MNISIVDLPNDVLLELFSRYVSIEDLGRLEQVCRRFYHLLRNDPITWRRVLARLTNVSLSQLRNAAGCPTLENIRHQSPVISHALNLPNDYQYEILLDRIGEISHLLPHDYRRPSRSLIPCSKLDCDTNRLLNNNHYLTSLACQWNGHEKYHRSTLISFLRRAQTSLLHYDEHHHHLWFTYDHRLHCLNLERNRMDYSYEFHNDDILCYKIYNDQLICLAHGDRLTIIARQTNEFYPCQFHPAFDGGRNDILALDVFSNDQERYLVLNGSRDHTISMRIFDMSTTINQTVWRTKVDDRVLCTRFTNDGHHFLIGTGGTSSLYPLILFDSERAQPIHIYNANYRLGAGVRCIEWVSPNVFIAAGFDNQFKEFDLRTGSCHYTFNDEFANDYCSLAVSVDHDGVANGILLGGNHHSTVRLVNRKQRQIQKVFFVSKQASPVHSMAVTSEYLFASVDRSIELLNFSSINRQFEKIRHRF